MGLTLSAAKSEKVQLGREAELFTLKVQKQGLFDFFLNWVVPIFEQSAEFPIFWLGLFGILVYESKPTQQQ